MCRWRHNNLCSRYDLYVVGQHGVLCKVSLLIILCCGLNPTWLRRPVPNSLRVQPFQVTLLPPFLSPHSLPPLFPLRSEGVTEIQLLCLVYDLDCCEKTSRSCPTHMAEPSRAKTCIVQTCRVQPLESNPIGLNHIWFHWHWSVPNTARFYI